MFGIGILTIIGILIFIAAGVVSAELDSALASVATFVIGLVVLEWGLEISLWTVFLTNPLWFIAALIIYIAAGAVFTLVWRWPAYISDHESEWMDEYHRWARERRQNEDNSFDAFIKSDQYYYNAWQHKERLGTWVGMWPFSFLWEISRKPAIWIWNTVYNNLGQAFQAAGLRTARKIHDRAQK